MVDTVFRNMETDDEEVKPVREGRYIIAVIGIDDYAHWPKLRNAVSDAEGTQKLFVDKLGFVAPFPPLINDNASQDAIGALVQDEMPKVLKEDDSLVLFFAGHGHTHTNNMAGRNIETGYIIPVKARTDRLSDYIKMDSLLYDIGQLPARHVLLILDACHSGFALGTAMKTYRDSVKYKEELISRVSRKVITSARREQRALDSGPVTGHSLFTGTLVHGFDTRKADLDGNGLVSSYELGLYLQQQVGQSSESKQTPDFGSFHFDDEGEMVISLRDEMLDVNKAQKHYKLGCVFYELGWLLDDPLRFRAAARQFKEAIELSDKAKRPIPDAERVLGKAYLASRAFDQATEIFSRMANRESLQEQCEALFHLGIIEVRKNNFDPAYGFFSDYLKKCPGDENVNWVEDYVEWLKQKVGGEKYALLIGINKYQEPEMPTLNGCVNDVEMMNRSLTEFCGFDQKRISVLTDNQATRQNIIRTFEQLKNTLSPQDVIVIHYSGHSVPDETKNYSYNEKEPHTYLIVHDTVAKADKLTNGITARELHEMVNSLPAKIKTLIIDSHPSSEFNRMVEEKGNYVLLLASDKSDLAYEHQLPVEGKTKPVGVFSIALIQKFAELPIRTLTYGQLIDATILRIKEFGFNQTPLLIGDREQRVFQTEEIHLNLYRFAQRRNYSSIKPEALIKLFSQAHDHLKIVFPQLYYSFGLAFIEKKNFALAEKALETAIRQRKGDYAEAKFAMGKAMFQMCDYERAVKLFQEIADTTLEKTKTDQLKTLVTQIKKLSETPKHALLVAINKYANSQLPQVQGAVNDIESVKEILISKFDFKPANITVLKNETATREAILESFKNLVESSQEAVTLFYFCGNGSFENDVLQTIVSADGRQEEVYDIPLIELAEMAKDAKNLVTVIDAGSFNPVLSTNKTGKGQGYRAVPSDDRNRTVRRFVAQPADENAASKLRIGAFTIYPQTQQPLAWNKEPKAEKRFSESGVKTKRWHGTLTHAILQSLSSFDTSAISAAQLSGAVSERLTESAAVFLPDKDPADYLFENRSQRAEVQNQILKIENAPINEAIGLMWNLIRQKEKIGDYYPEGRMNVGIMHGFKGEYDDAISALERAISLYRSKTVMKSEIKKDSEAESLRSEAHYQYGRFLFESERDFNKAVSELNDAIRLDPDNVRAYYYLGLAIREMVERETLSKAEEALKTYLIKGAPLGHEDEVREFLGSRRIQGTGAG